MKVERKYRRPEGKGKQVQNYRWRGRGKEGRQLRGRDKKMLVEWEGQTGCQQGKSGKQDVSKGGRGKQDVSRGGGATRMLIEGEG